MKKILKVSEDMNFTAVNVGKLAQIVDHSFVEPKMKQEIKGKIFLKDITKSTGTEISMNVLPAHTEVPYFHFHRKNEETYIILSGEGQFQVDDNCFNISEGSVIRVAPAGKRCMINTSDEAMIYIVIQAKEDSLEEYTLGDGSLVEYTPKWKSE